MVQSVVSLARDALERDGEAKEPEQAFAIEHLPKLCRLFNPESIAPTVNEGVERLGDVLRLVGGNPSFGRSIRESAPWDVAEEP